MLRFLTAGESHGPALSLIVEGLPAGLAIDEDKLNSALAKRQKGYGRGGRMAIETDKVKVTAGIRFGKTIGSPVSILIENKDWANWQKDMSIFGEESFDRDVNKPRPGHADLTGILKYDLLEARSVLERASARKTATRVAVGALANCLLEELDIRVASHVRSIGSACLPEAIEPSIEEIVQKIDLSDVSCVCDKTAVTMREVVDKAKGSGDTLGGVVEVRAENVIPGLGSYVHWDRRLDGLLAQAIVSIPAFKAVEIGEGIKAATSFGSDVHDEIYPTETKSIRRESNRAGGLEGGMTNGEPLVVRGYMKPIPTLMKPLSSVDLKTGKQAIAEAERSDTCAVPAAAVVAEAMVKWVLAVAVLEKFACDNMTDLKSSVESYKDRIRQGGYAPWQL